MPTNHGSIEWLKFPDPNHPGDDTRLIKKWLRDSWARRKILALQQAIAAIVVPTASTANPQMDGTAAPGVSTDYARADHVHPHDSSKADTATTYTKSQVDALIPTVPTNVSAFTNDAGYLTSAPVTSVNSQTGAVNLTASDVGALPTSTAIPSKTSDLTNDSGYITASAVPSASTSNPAMDGTASAGSSTAWARGDHVHPSDTSKQDALTSAQMDAVNSGITATDVANIQTVTTGGFSVNSANYIDSVSGSWVRIGNVVVFSLSYTMKAAVSSGLANAISGFPTPSEGAVTVIAKIQRSDTTMRYIVVESDKGGLSGAHTSGSTYHASGAYIAQ